MKMGWLLMAIPLFETGLPSRLEKIRYQAYIVAALACGWLLTSHVLGMGLYVERPWLSLIPAALLTYGAAARLYVLGARQPAGAPRHGQAGRQVRECSCRAVAPDFESIGARKRRLISVMGALPIVVDVWSGPICTIFRWRSSCPGSMSSQVCSTAAQPSKTT